MNVTFEQQYVTSAGIFDLYLLQKHFKNQVFPVSLIKFLNINS